MYVNKRLEDYAVVLLVSVLLGSVLLASGLPARVLPTSRIYRGGGTETRRPPVRARRVRTLVIVAAFALITVGCGGSDSSDSTSGSTGATQDLSERSAGSDFTLPERQGPRVETSGDVPHVQIDVGPVAEVDSELRRRAFLFPGVTSEPSAVSLPGAVRLALDPDLELARPDVIASSGEFAHIHPDGSLHVWLPIDVAAEVDGQRWGELHPWVDRDGFWDGVVMVYTPQTAAEVDVTISILAEAYNFVVGANVDASDIN